MKNLLIIFLAAVLLSSCATHPPTKAGYTAKFGANNVAPRVKENRHF